MRDDNRGVMRSWSYAERSIPKGFFASLRFAHNDNSSPSEATPKNQNKLSENVELLFKEAIIDYFPSRQEGREWGLLTQS